MATHFKDRQTPEGQWTACGVLHPNNVPLGRGVVITTKVGPGIGEVTCHGCIGSEQYKAAKARLRPALDAPQRRGVG